MAPAPYRLASFAALAGRADVDLDVVFLRSGIERHAWGDLKSRIRFGFRVLEGGMVTRAVQLARRLIQRRPDLVIVGGWNRFEYWLGAGLGMVIGRPVVVWSESTARDWRKASSARRLIVKLLVGTSSGVLACGRGAAEYARTMGARRVWIAVNATDDVHPAGDISTPPVGTRGDAASVLFVGRLAREKGIDTLLRAWRGVESEVDAQLILVGSGPSESALVALGRRLGLHSVTWIPYVDPRLLHDWYSRADVFVLPSRSEAWGFVVNEAMAHALPIVATTAVGSVRELVRPGVNGWLVEPGDVESLSERLLSLLSSAEVRERMGAASADIIAGISPARWAEAVALMAHEVIDPRYPRRTNSPSTRQSVL